MVQEVAITTSRTEQTYDGVKVSRDSLPDETQRLARPIAPLHKLDEGHASGTFIHIGIGNHVAAISRHASQRPGCFRTGDSTNV